MAKVISQETFDEVVKENICEWSMSAADAKEETIKQFEAQGINLANIIKDLTINEETGEPLIKEIINKLKIHKTGEVYKENDFLNLLNVLNNECEKSVPHRVLAGKLGALSILVSLLEIELSKEIINEIILKALINTTNTLLNKQPDLFSNDALNTIIKILSLIKNEEIISQTLQCLGKVCILHEINRQNIMNADIIQYLKPWLSHKKIVKDVCGIFRLLILDDDIRVQFGKAHEHARLISNEILIDLVKLMPEIEDVNIICDIILTIASLTVRQEFCVAVEDAGGLKFTLNLMAKYYNNIKVCREGLKFLKALAGHDTVKTHIIENGAAPIIQNILNLHKENETLVKIALACISTLTLRVKENSMAFFETGIAETIIEAMKIHAGNKIIQRNGAWSIRNMVSRLRDQCPTFISLGVEELLNTSMTTHPSIKQDIKSALRDLGCKVDLKEEWTGAAKVKILN